MKKLLTLIALISFSTLYGQSDLKITEGSAKVKPLIVLNYLGDQVIMKDRSLDGVEPEWIETINVLKGSSATSIYGERDAKDGVIILTLKKAKEIKAFFEEELKRTKLLTEIGYPGDASLKTVKEEKRSSSNATIRLREANSSILKPLIVVDYQGETMKLSEDISLDEITLENVSSISVLKDQESLEQYEAVDKPGIIVLKLDSSKKSGRLFKKLKKAHK